MAQLEDLIEAVKRGDLTNVASILEGNPALAHDWDQLGATALHYATFGGHRFIVEELVRRGADVNATDSRFGATPTGWAIEYLRKWAVFWELN